MSWSLRSQMLLPLAALLILVIYQLATRVTYLYWEEIDRRENAQPKWIAQELGPLVEADLQTELENLHRENPGWRFAALRQDELLTSTVFLSPRDRTVIGSIPPQSPDQTTRDLIIDIDDPETGGWHWVAVTRVPNWPEEARLAAFYALDQVEQVDSQAQLLMHSAASVAAGLLIVAATWLSGGLSRRIRRIQEQVKKIAEGDFRRTIEEAGRDEVGDLAHAVNSMTAQLQQMQTAIQQTELTRQPLIRVPFREFRSRIKSVPSTSSTRQ